MRSVRRKTQGMTLLEVLVVVAIAASIIGGVVVILQGQNDERRRDAAIQRQSSDMATRITVGNGLVALVPTMRWMS